MYKRHIHNSGFTIIELGVVMVILGLLLSGILIGQELIKSALLRNIINQLNEYDTATNSFFLKYGALPGDIRTAELHGLGQPGGPGENGNGDHSIGNDTLITDEELFSTGSELRNFWYHLAQAGLIPGNYDGSFFSSSAPRTKLRNIFILASAYRYNATGEFTPDNGYLVGLNRADWDTTIATSRAGTPKLLPGEAYTLDQKLDDGEAFEGRVRNFGRWAPQCQTPGGIYQVGEDVPRCAVTVSMRGAAQRSP